MNKRKICVVTGTRAEYGLLYWVMKEIENHPEFTLQVIATGMHLSTEFGETYKVIEEDFAITRKVEMLLSADTPSSVVKSMGLGCIGFAEAFTDLQPDLVMVLGDRYELLCAGQASLIMQIPLAHLIGGDTTEGAFDEAIRHSLTKIAHIHFPSNKQSAQRIIQMGEDPEMVFPLGNPGLDHISRITYLNRDEWAATTGYTFREHNLLATFHPVTLEQNTSKQQFSELLAAIEEYCGKYQAGVVFTKANSDTFGRVINDMIDEFCAARTFAHGVTSLGQQRYLSALRLFDMVVGNSSSGLYEVPSFHKPTINIGDRQKGRLRGASVIDCDPTRSSITAALQKGREMDCRSMTNPYGGDDIAKGIVATLARIPNYKRFLKKHFFDLPLA